MGELVTQKEKADGLRGLVGKYEKDFTKLLPAHIPAARFCRVAIYAAINTPKLLDCTKRSFIGALLECGTLGLEPGVAGQCWLIPYAKKATLVLGYRGLLQLQYRSGKVSVSYANVVYESDEFEYELYPPRLIHKPVRGVAGAEPERGGLMAVYSVMKNALGHEHWNVMEGHEVLKIKAMAPNSDKKDSPWIRWEPAMWKKTGLKQHNKVMPISIEDRSMERAVELDNRADAGMDQGLEINIEPGDVRIEEEEPPQADAVQGLHPEINY